MVDLLQNYSLSNILIFIVILALAIKGIISFFDWGNERLQKFITKKNKPEQQYQIMKQDLDNYKNSLKQIINTQQDLQKNVQEIEKNINFLLESDKEDIKSYIVEKHHFFCYEQHWIDEYSLDCIEKRYTYYTTEGGNSFIKSLMKELQTLPKQPPQN